MADEIGKGKSAATPVQEPAKKAEPEMAFQERVAAERWPLSDDFWVVKVVERPEQDILSLGFMGAAGNKKIVLSASLDKWQALFNDGLVLVKAMREEAAKSKG